MILLCLALSSPRPIPEPEPELSPRLLPSLSVALVLRRPWYTHMPVPPLAWRKLAGHSGLLGRCSGTSNWKPPGGPAAAGGSRRLVRRGMGSHHSRVWADRLVRR